MLKKIHKIYSSLSKTNKIIADFLINNYQEFVFLTLTEISDELNVSEASIYRFTVLLGYDGFKDFKANLRRYIKEKKIPMKDLRKQINFNNENDDLTNTIEQNISSLKNLYNVKINDKFEKIIDKIKNADQIYIFALRSSFTMAYYFYFVLNQYKDNIHIITLSHDNLYEKLRNIKEKDVYITLSFAPYTNKTVEALDFINKKGIFSIGITDDYSSPLYLRSDLSISIPTGGTYSLAPVMTFLNAILISLGKLDKDKTLKKLEENDEMLFNENVYYQKMNKRS